MRQISILFVILLFFACGSKTTAPAKDYGVLQSQRNDSLYTLVGNKHDEVMPKDADIERFMHQIRGREFPAPQKDSALQTLSALNTAHEAMMDWMHQFKNIDLEPEFYKPKSESDIWAYLQQEEKNIEEVARKMLFSITQAQQMLGIKN